MPKKNPTNPIDEEKLAAAESEALTSESDEASVAVENLDEKAEAGLVAEQGADADQTAPAELAAIHSDNESAQVASGDDLETATKLALTSDKKNKSQTKSAAKKTAKAVAPKSVRSKKYLGVKAQVEPGRQYSIDEAIELVKKISLSKFDGAVELHLKLTKKKAKGSTESTRGTFHLPHGSGKNKKIILLDEAKIEAIAKTKKIDFDVALATPDLMPKVAKIAKILGPKGKMPDPKAGTVTTDPQKTIDEINSGKVEYRIDGGNNIHQIVGRISWESSKIKDNTLIILGSLPKSKIAAAYLVASISPSVTLDLSFLK